MAHMEVARSLGCPCHRNLAAWGLDWGFYFLRKPLRRNFWQEPVRRARELAAEGEVQLLTCCSEKNCQFYHAGLAVTNSVLNKDCMDGFHEHWLGIFVPVVCVLLCETCYTSLLGKLHSLSFCTEVLRCSA